jgi:exonuclease SbcD
MREQVAARFPHLLEIRHQPATPAVGSGRGVLEPAAADPVEVARDFVRHVTGGAISDAELDVFRAAHESVLAAGVEA